MYEAIASPYKMFDVSEGTHGFSQPVGQQIGANRVDKKIVETIEFQQTQQEYQEMINRIIIY